jgi:tRNA pseudouridine38-40 synthase
VRVALGIEYLGTRYCGWQSQSNRCGIQDTIQAALTTIAEHPIHVHCAGRTDTGVHAREQVVHFDTDAARPLTAWVRGSNANLPDDIAVLWASPVGEEFHARFSARSRRYRYILLNRPQRPGLSAGRVGWYHQPLEVDAMRRAAQRLVGTQDFSAFRSSECQAKTPIKTLHNFAIATHGEFIIFDLHADGFLHHMVRNIVGSLIYVGSERGDSAWIDTLLAQRDRRLAAPTFAPDGLYLMSIEYDVGWALPQRSLSRHDDALAEMSN